MKRPIAAVLAAALFVSGCVTQQPLLQAGEDPNAMAEAIARKGQDDGSGAPGPPATVGDCVQTAKKVGASCMLISLVAAWCLAPGPHNGATGIGDAWNEIWSDD
ncbi:MAG TPA: hypothetical protein VG013_09995 [Gemmataceae bacterium]|nr:hypothetical protein [Gemmataceae bacterium]